MWFFWVDQSWLGDHEAKTVSPVKFSLSPSALLDARKKLKPMTPVVRKSKECGILKMILKAKRKLKKTVTS